jgi:hypothetical protein
LEAKETFEVSRMNNKYSIFLGYHAVCKTHHSVSLKNENIRMCLPGDVSEHQEINKLRSDEAGEACNYTTYSNPDNLGEPVKASDYSECGFNKKDHAW